MPVTGRLLRIDLSHAAHRSETIPEHLMQTYLGSRGLNMYRLYHEIPAQTDPLGPDNKLIFGTGRLDGTLYPGTRFNVSARSPQTGLVGDSNAGGFWGAEMRFAGWDQIVLEGRSPEPVFIYIEDDQVQLRPAKHLQGQDVWNTHRLIREELADPDVQIACVGPAAENGVRFAGIFTNLVRAAARTGMGTVLASKNVKAVAIRGHQPVRVSDPKAFLTLIQKIEKHLQQHPEFASRKLLGTPRLLTSLNALGALVNRKSL